MKLLWNRRSVHLSKRLGGEDLYPGKLRKATALCFGLIQNHPFIDDPFAQRLHIFDGDCLVYQGGSSAISPIQAAA